jgi:uncharacterized repeat protein (TIGR01451 family)
MSTSTDLVVQAHGPSSVIAGRPFTYTYTITNIGTQEATGVRFADAVPSDLELTAFAPRPPLCKQRGDSLSCYLYEPGSREPVTFTLVISGLGGQPMVMELDPLIPGWPICYVIKERTYLHVLHCELGGLKRDQARQVSLVLRPVGVQERTTANTASVWANEADLELADNMITSTMSVDVGADLSARSSLSGEAVAGETLSFTLTVANLGPSDADDVVLSDTWAAGTDLISAVASRGDECRIEPGAAPAQAQGSGPRVICDLGRLDRGEIARVTILVAFDDPLAAAPGGGISHSAWVVAGQADPNASNNELTDSILLGAGDGD